ncbi:LysR family transcriptional regulator [Pseudomonas sp. BN102]|uniref:LysR family transcriptional regulator n=1 Tax=Pseudomonas sp. BN102 TaxID=2567886 RepID=UPI0024568D3E|nr:LysR family transcriptional regulator [Pseudomonas sp. BN102]MDH4610453.1 LysR family transcriptional regulator [Pseudomonas sp. BN102]
MEFRQLRQALVLAETLNFHRAAEQLNMTQPPLSTSIKKLEDELGVLLFERLPSGLRLTSAGEAVLRNARSVLFFAEEMRRAAREGEAGERGQLRVGFVGSAAYALLPNIIRSFHERYPHVDLVLEEGVGSELLQRLDEHELDVALVRYPILQSSAAEITPLQREHLVLAVRHDSPLAASESLGLADLADQPFIVSSQSRSPSLHALMLQAFEEAGIRPRIAQQAAQMSTVLGLVEGGLGIAMIPAAAAKYVGPHIRTIPLVNLSANLVSGIALAMLADTHSATARNFREHALRMTVSAEG